MEQLTLETIGMDFGPEPVPPTHRGDEYEARRAREAYRQAEMSARGRDIGKIPPVADPARRERCRESLRAFCETYFPEIFYLPWASFQLDTIERLQASAVHGGLFSIAMPRGSGKTQLCTRAAIWAAVYGYRRFIVVIGAEDKATRDLMRGVKLAFEANPLIQADFPEVCYPVSQLDGITNRCKGQTCDGERTFIEWSDQKLVFPTVPGSAIGGTVINSTTLTGRIRGMNAETPDGQSIRPDFVIIDDPQTRESAKSLSQTADRLALINSDILGMAGPGRKITAVMPCTVIYPNDLADQMLNRELYPEWHGKRYSLLDGMPKHIPLWTRYWDIRARCAREDRSPEEATRFYITNRSQMDEGCTSTWPERFEPDDISGIQYAMNIYLSDKQRFFSEYQNAPMEIDIAGGEKITAEQILRHLDHRPRLEIPADATRLVLFVDVQQNLLYWLLMAVADDFTSWIVDYNAFPEQPRPIFTTAEASPTYGDIYPGSSPEGSLTSALADCILPILERSFPREDGAELRVSRCLIDSGWGPSAAPIYRFIRQSGHAALILPSKGAGITATSTPISEYRRKPGEIVSSYEWRIAPVRNNRQVRLLTFDANWWKTFYRNRLYTPAGEFGSISICGTSIGDRERMLADHLSSEYSIEEISNGRRCDIWKLLPARENHWLDGVIGCLVAASEQGCTLPIAPPTATGKEARPAPRPSTASRPASRLSAHRYAVSNGYQVATPYAVKN